VSDLTPYEKELAKLLHDIPLPDEDQAWNEMSKLLDKDNNKVGGKISPNSRYILWGLLGLTAVVGAIFLFTHTSKQEDTQKNNSGNQTTMMKDQPLSTENEQTVKQNAINNPVANNKVSTGTRDQSANGNSSASNLQKNTVDHLEPTIARGDIKKKKNKLSPKGNINNGNENEVSLAPVDKTIANTPYASTNKVYSIHRSRFSSSRTSSVKGIRRYINNTEQTTHDVSDNYGMHSHKKGSLKINKARNPKYRIKHMGSEDSLANQDDQTMLEQKTVITDTPTVQSVSSRKTGADSLLTKPLLAAVKNPTDTTIKKQKAPKDNKKKKAYFAAGIAAQQSVDRSCNCAYPNNIDAPAVAKDYLPSVYLRFYDKKWFLQTEFNYAAPQYVNGFVYHRIQDQPIALHDTMTSFTIKKTYSHEGLISFHYFILPSLSIGTGLIYNIFSGADIEKTIQKKSIGADSLISSAMITDKDDTSFSKLVKNDLQLLLEAQYKWKRFSVGARYTIGLTPYIKYSDPYSQTATQKENNSFDVFVRYELWKQK
jgi:hypothetical protein